MNSALGWDRQPKYHKIMHFGMSNTKIVRDYKTGYRIIFVDIIIEIINKYNSVTGILKPIAELCVDLNLSIVILPTNTIIKMKP